MAWEVDDKTATASVVDYIQLNSMAIDEYPYQNKLGDSSKGAGSIQMIRIDN